MSDNSPSNQTANTTSQKSTTEINELSKTSEFGDTKSRVTGRQKAGERVRYPNNLDTSEQPHSINFFISEYVPGAGESSSLVANSTSIADQQGVASARTGNGISSENRQNVEQLGRQAVAFTASVIAQQSAKAVTKNSGSVVSAGAQIFAGVGAAKAVDSYVSRDATSIKSTPAIRIKDSISLHISQSPQAKYTAEFENESIGTVLGTLATSSGTGTLNAISEAVANGTAGELVARGLIDAATIPKELGLGNVNFGGLARAASKKVRNPYQEQIFRTMNFRSFAFQYKFAPRNKKELDSVEKIINLFKFHMHPEKADDGAFFLFPSLFDIEYRYKQKRNTFVNKIATSVLTDMTVDYGSEGVFTTFRGTKGSPSEVTLALQFREISLLTKGKDGQLTNGSTSGY